MNISINWDDIVKLVKKFGNVYLIVGIIVGSIFGSFWGYRYTKSVMEYLGVNKSTQESVTPPTYKSEELNDLKEQLISVEKEIREIRDSIEAKVSVNNSTVSCGINDIDLEDWEISISGKDSFGLKKGDDVLLINSYSNHLQSAKFKVKYTYYDDGKSDTTIYINNNGVSFFNIHDSGKMGMFDLKLQKL